MEVCLVLRDQISAFSIGMSTAPEFSAGCLSVSGDASLLLFEANSKRYPIPTDDDGETQLWVKSKRRYLYVEASTSDNSQTVRIAK